MLLPTLKAILRARPERSIGGLWDTVGAIVGLFSPDECANYSTATEHAPDLAGNALERFRSLLNRLRSDALPAA